MQAVERVIRGIDFKLLREQKRGILDHIKCHTEKELIEPLDGIINLIDAIQDAVVVDGIATEKEVFNYGSD